MIKLDIRIITYNIGIITKEYTGKTNMLEPAWAIYIYPTTMYTHSRLSAEHPPLAGI